MSVNICMADDGRSAVVNGKNVYQDSNDNWVATKEELTHVEKQSFFRMLRMQQRTQFPSAWPLNFCKVGRTYGKAAKFKKMKNN